MSITRSTNPALLLEGLKEIFGVGYAKYPDKYKKIFDLTTSEKEVEQYQEVGGFGLHTVKAEGQISSLDTTNQGPKTYIENIAYALRYLISHEALADNQYDRINQNLIDLGTSAGRTMEVIAINRLNTAFSTATADKLADGSAMCATDHTLSGSNGTGSNTAASAADLSEASLITAINDIASFVDPRGLKIQATPELLIVPQGEAVTAQKLLFSELTVGSANNDINVFGRQAAGGQMFPQGYVISNDISDSDAFFIRTSQRGLTFQTRQSPIIKDDYVNKSMQKEVTSYMRFGVGCYDWRSIYGNPGA